MWIDGGSKVRVFCKGAPEIVIEMCTKYIGEAGAIFELEDEKKEYATQTIVSNFAAKCLRTLLVCYVDFDEAEWNRMKNENNGFATTRDM